MPYKLRDPGVNLSYAGEETIDGKTYDKLALSFGKVGLTPGDRYWVYINRDTGLMDRWAYILQDMPKEGPPTVWKWEGWQKYGNIMLAPHRTQVGDDRKLELSRHRGLRPDAGFGLHVAGAGEVGRPMSGHLHAIYLKRFKKGPMDPKETATWWPAGARRQRQPGGRRQVILLAEEGWTEATAELGVDLDPATRRGNLLLSGHRPRKDTRAHPPHRPRPPAHLDRMHPLLPDGPGPFRPQGSPAPPLAGRRLRRGDRRRRDPRRRRGGLGGGRAGGLFPDGG